MSGSDDDDDVFGIDLDAWQPPPVPGGIADAVIAQMRRETTSVTTQALPVEAQERPAAARRRWWIAGGGVALAAAAAALVAFGVTRPPANGQGGVVAERPKHVALGPSSADLDERAVVTWRRERYRLVAQQAGGAATWRVHEDDNLTIETALGSIEATNASLRVEVKMLDEKKAIALSAVTSAAVALVTVVVYEGTVRVTRDGKSEAVAAGSAYQIKANGENVIEQEMVGAAPDLAAKIASLEAQLAQKQAEIDALTARTVEDGEENADEVDDAAPEVRSRPLPRGLGDAAISKGLDAVRAQIQACGGDFSGTVIANVRVKADGSVAGVTMSPTDAKPNACIAAAILTTSFAKTVKGDAFGRPFAFGEAAKPCDVDELSEEGRDAMAQGMFARALHRFERAYACKPETTSLKFAFAAACKAKNVGKARVYWAKLNRELKDSLLSLCAANDILVEHLEGHIAGEGDVGRLRVTNRTPATVLVDGQKVGVTPVNLELAPGRHKVTFVIGSDKYTYAVVVKAGETVTLDKQLR